VVFNTILNRLFPVIRNLMLLLVLAAGPAYAQTLSVPERPPQDVKLCDLLRNPNTYDGQRIRVSGKVNRDFEDFSLHGLECGSQVSHPIWLQYGDDKTNAGAEVGHRFIQADPLVKDGAYQFFSQQITAQRLLEPDLKTCNGPECHYYHVTATLTGRFFAGIEPGRSTGVKTFTGFGRGDCCHLLVIEQVSEVRSERTQVPVGGQFQCSTEDWVVPAANSSDSGQMFAAIGKHWGDDTSQGTISAGKWIAPDLLTSYSVEILTTPGDKKNAPYPKTTVTRESCHAVQTFAPRPVTEPVSCETRQWRWTEDRQGAKDLQQSVTMGHDPWRLELRTSSRSAVDEAFKQWGLLPASPHMVDRCGNPVIDEGQVAECGWSSLDGMTTVLVRLHKFDYVKHFGGHWENVMWIATEVDGSFCHAPGEKP